VNIIGNKTKWVSIKDEYSKREKTIWFKKKFKGLNAFPM